jgi:catechol 2,3-dioxygenase-like lactoylglutathione lyase family enzyme
MIKGISHAGIGVRDMEVSLRFYCGLLGLEVVSDMEVEGPIVDDIVGLKDAKVRIVHLRCGEGQELELFQYMSPGTSVFSKSFRQCDGGIIHAALVVDNLMELYERLTAAGVTSNSKPYDLGGALCVYMRDPDGITIELVQRIDG